MKEAARFEGRKNQADIVAEAQYLLESVVQGIRALHGAAGVFGLSSLVQKLDRNIGTLLDVRNDLVALHQQLERDLKAGKP